MAATFYSKLKELLDAVDIKALSEKEGNMLTP